MIYFSLLENLSLCITICDQLTNKNFRWIKFQNKVGIGIVSTLRVHDPENLGILGTAQISWLDFQFKFHFFNTNDMNEIRTTYSYLVYHIRVHSLNWVMILQYPLNTYGSHVYYYMIVNHDSLNWYKSIIRSYSWEIRLNLYRVQSSSAISLSSSNTKSIAHIQSI